MNLTESTDGKKRCFGAIPDSALYAEYHDNEWGVPVHDERTLFEFIVLEGAQAGLSWETVLNKRVGYRAAFKGFDPALVAVMTDQELEVLREDASIIRNKLKIYSARRNACVFLDIAAEFGSFSKYLWAFVDNTPLLNAPSSFDDIPARTELSDTISEDLKARGMNFVGSTIIYAYMQAVGLVNDHIHGCWKSSIRT